MNTGPLPITLIATIGSSPAVLTEALYELHRQNIWPVKKIIIITTALGRQVLEEQLFAYPNGGFYRWCSDSGIAPHSIHIDDRWVIPDGETGQPLHDIRSSADDRRFAEIVQQTVRKYCQGEDQRVFGLLSGGRKTMGAHLFSAMQLFARMQDQLLHVLVSEPFDSLPDFFYPERESRLLNGRDGETYDAAHAKITLVNIPFLRLRSYLSDTSLSFDQPYTTLLRQVSEHLRTAAEKPVRTLSVDLSQRKLYLNGTGWHNGFLLPSRELALVAWMAARSLLDKTVISVMFEELEQPAQRWLIHLLYYMISRKEAEKDIWMTDPDYRRVSKTKTELKRQTILKLARLEWPSPPQLHHLFSFTENARNAARAEHQLLIPSENISLIYSGDINNLKAYLTTYRNRASGQNLPELTDTIYQGLLHLLTLIQPAP